MGSLASCSSSRRCSKRRPVFGALGVLMRYCLCQSLTGRADLSTPSPLPPLKLFGVWRDLNAAAMTDWVGHVQAREGKKRFLSHRWLLACDRGLYSDQNH